VFPIKRQFFFSFSVYGAVLPYLSVVLADRGLSMGQIGQVLSLTGVAIMVSPVVTTLLADTRVQSRTLLGILFALSAASLALLAGVRGFWLLLIVHGFFALAYAPVNALQDGLYFHRKAELEAMPTVNSGDVGSGGASSGGAGSGGVAPYHVVRVFGTLGFIAPSLLLYLLLRQGLDASAALWCGAACAAAGAFNAVTLPRQRRAELAEGEKPPGSKLPTLAAARALCKPHTLVFCLAMLLLHLATTAYYGFYPLYLTDTLGVPDAWVGLITTIGVVVEIGFMLGFGWFVARFGLRGLMIWGSVVTLGRFALLAMFPNVGVAVATQLLHGMMVLIIHVAPPVYLNRHAEPAYRNSIQGLFAMAIYGTGRIFGNLLAGWVADVSLVAVFGWAAGLSLLAAALFIFAFAEKPPPAEAVR
jgi:PPP family 3-phenylpropionic acid transporter